MSVTTMPAFDYLGASDLSFLKMHLRGIAQAQVRFYQSPREFQAEVLEALLSLGVSASAEEVLQIAPLPRRRFAIRYEGRRAFLTVSSNAPLNG